ncbi:helix-turn-helix transcriptional regulator [Serratia sp. M24T3]|uniref:helix-turn-helix domain-containing protein n=1 Tax=Serratia sp. M24T3 TaxID=932213 RepID=UPI00025B91F5|nr:helix-turn-helix transcriptional regulator [Serratia sp. M24T3]EIC82713.1 sugar fermentation stimulation protein B [Serratia sp. M24T3]
MIKFSKPDWDREDIMAAVRKAKKSLSALSREHGLASSTLSNALQRPWPKGEKIIANSIGLEPENIWPSRYLVITIQKVLLTNSPVKRNILRSVK